MYAVSMYNPRTDPQYRGLMKVSTCNSRYLGRAPQRLENQIRQHVPKWIRSRINATRTQPLRSNKNATTQPDCDSAIGQHPLKKRKCTRNYEDTKFSILAIALSQFQLRLLEATYIKIRQPFKCKQKEFVFSQQLFK